MRIGFTPVSKQRDVGDSIGRPLDGDANQRDAPATGMNDRHRGRARRRVANTMLASVSRSSAPSGVEHDRDTEAFDAARSPWRPARPPPRELVGSSTAPEPRESRAQTLAARDAPGKRILVDRLSAGQPPTTDRQDEPFNADDSPRAPRRR